MAFFIFTYMYTKTNIKIDLKEFPLQGSLEDLEISKMSSWFKIIGLSQNKINSAHINIRQSHAFHIHDFKNDIFFNRCHGVYTIDELKLILKHINPSNSFYIDIPSEIWRKTSYEFKRHINLIGTYETLIYNLNHAHITPPFKKENKFQLKQINKELWKRLIPFLVKDKNIEFQNRFKLLPLLLNEEKWAFYSLWELEKPVAIGGFFINNNSASFCSTYIPENERGRGIHEILIFERLQILKEMGLKKIVAQAYSAGPSINNLKKQGFKLAMHSNYGCLGKCNFY